MDDQNQPTNQPNDPTTKADVTTSAPVEMEPETGATTPVPSVQTAGTVSPSMSNTTSPSSSSSPDAPQSDPMAQPPAEPALPVGAQPDGLLEAPKKKSMAFMVLIVVVLIVALAALGYMIYKMIY